MSPALIVAIVEALPALMQAVPRILSLIERYLNWTNSKDLNQWLDELEAGVNKLESAETPQDKIDAARTLLDAIRHVE